MQIRNQKLSTRGGNREDRADWKHQIVESVGFNDGLNVGRKNRRLKDDSRFLAWVIQWQFFRWKITRKTDLRVKMFDFRLNVDFEVLRSEVQQRSLDWILGKHPRRWETKPWRNPDDTGWRQFLAAHPTATLSLLSSNKL